MLPNLCWYTQKQEEFYTDHNTLHSQEATQEFVEPWPARLNFWICPWAHSFPGQGRLVGRMFLHLQAMNSVGQEVRYLLPPRPQPKTNWGEFESPV